MKVRREQAIRWLALFLLAAALLGAALLWARAMRVKHTSSPLQLRPKVVIDAGHGGIDGGASAGEQTIEKNLNLEIALKLRELLQAGGFHVIMTREDDRSLHSNSAHTIRQQKNQDLKARLALLQENADGVFVSIHQNTYPQSSSWGAQVFYGTADEGSQKLARLIQGEVSQRLQPENKREIKPAQSNLFLLYQAKSPAVLVECGFLSNPAECQKLQDPAYQDALAFALFSAISEYYYG